MNIPINQRKIGVEIECIGELGSVAKAKIEAAGGTIGEDGSIRKDNDSDEGYEITTAPLPLPEMNTALEAICNTLKGHTYVNASCGFHIHIDFSDSSLFSLKALWGFYSAFDSVILSFVPRSRRTNTFCIPLSRWYSTEAVRNCLTMEEAEKLWYSAKSTRGVKMAKDETKHHSRYKGFNLHPFFREGHYEIRYHSGTIEKEKMIRWIELHLHILEAATLRGAELEILSRDIHAVIDPHEKMKIFFNALPKLLPATKEYFLQRAKLLAGL